MRLWRIFVISLTLSLWVARWFCWSCIVFVSGCDLVWDLTGDTGTPSMQPLILQVAYDRAATRAPLVSEKPHFGLEQAPFCRSPLDKVNFTTNLYSKSFTMYCRSGQEGLQSPLTRMGAVQAVEWMGLMCKVSVLWFLPTTGESLQGFSSYRFFLMPLLSFLCWDQGPGLRCSLNWVPGTHKCTFCVGLFQDIMNKDEI